MKRILSKKQKRKRMLILSAILLSEPMSIYGIIGAVLILASTFVASFEFKKN